MTFISKAPPTGGTKMALSRKQEALRVSPTIMHRSERISTCSSGVHPSPWKACGVLFIAVTAVRMSVEQRARCCM